MMGISTVRSNLADILSREFRELQVYSAPPDAVVPPGIIIEGFQGVPATFGAAMDQMTLSVRAIASRTSPEQIRVVDGLVDPTLEDSIPAVIEAYPTLEGAVSSVVWQEFGEYGVISIGGVMYYTAVVTCGLIF